MEALIQKLDSFLNAYEENIQRDESGHESLMKYCSENGFTFPFLPSFSKSHFPTSQLDQLLFETLPAKEKEALLGPLLDAERGRNAETAVTQSFQQCFHCYNLGGILLTNVCIHEFRTSVNTKKAINAKLPYKLVSLPPEIENFFQRNDMEFDHMLIHPFLGIVILETKSKERPTENEPALAVQRSVNVASEQLNKREKFIKTLYKTMFPDQDELVIHKVICLPCATFSASNERDINILDKSMHQPSAWYEYWKSKMSCDYTKDRSFARFAAFLMIMSQNNFVSDMDDNIQQRIKVIDQNLGLTHPLHWRRKHQKRLGKNDITTTRQSKPTSSFKLIPDFNEQHRFWLPAHLLCATVDLGHSGKLFLHGHPGTGKTIAMLNFAFDLITERMANKDESKICVFCVPRYLRRKFEDFLTANFVKQYDQENEQKVLKKYAAVVDYGEVDQKREFVANDRKYHLQSQSIDLFCDEMSIDLLSANWMDHLTDRSVQQGITFVIAHSPECGTEIQDLFYDSASGFKTCKLTTIIRGTIQIARYAGQTICSSASDDLPTNTFNIGQSIPGNSVIPFSVKGRREVNDTILKIVQKARNDGFYYHQMAIVHLVDRSDDIKQKLSDFNIRSKDIFQPTTKDAVTVVSAEQSRSYDWPLVVAVAADQTLEVFKVAVSRALLSLFVIIDENMKQIIETNRTQPLTEKEVLPLLGDDVGRACAKAMEAAIHKESGYLPYDIKQALTVRNESVRNRSASQLSSQTIGSMAPLSRNAQERLSRSSRRPTASSDNFSLLSGATETGYGSLKPRNRNSIASTVENVIESPEEVLQYNSLPNNLRQLYYSLRDFMQRYYERIEHQKGMPAIPEETTPINGNDNSGSVIEILDRCKKARRALQRSLIELAQIFDDNLADKESQPLVQRLDKMLWPLEAIDNIERNEQKDACLNIHYTVMKLYDTVTGYLKITFQSFTQFSCEAYGAKLKFVIEHGNQNITGCTENYRNETICDLKNEENTFRLHPGQLLQFKLINVEENRCLQTEQIFPFELLQSDTYIWETKDGNLNCKLDWTPPQKQTEVHTSATGENASLNESHCLQDLKAARRNLTRPKNWPSLPEHAVHADADHLLKRSMLSKQAVIQRSMMKIDSLAVSLHEHFSEEQRSALFNCIKRSKQWIKNASFQASCFTSFDPSDVADLTDVTEQRVSDEQNLSRFTAANQALRAALNKLDEAVSRSGNSDKSVCYSPVEEIQEIIDAVDAIDEIMTATEHEDSVSFTSMRTAPSTTSVNSTEFQDTPVKEEFHFSQNNTNLSAGESYTEINEQQSQIASAIFEAKCEPNGICLLTQSNELCIKLASVKNSVQQVVEFFANSKLRVTFDPAETLSNCEKLIRTMQSAGLREEDVVYELENVQLYFERIKRHLQHTLAHIGQLHESNIFEFVGDEHGSSKTAPENTIAIVFNMHFVHEDVKYFVKKSLENLLPYRKRGFKNASYGLDETVKSFLKLSKANDENKKVSFCYRMKTIFNSKDPPLPVFLQHIGVNGIRTWIGLPFESNENIEINRIGSADETKKMSSKVNFYCVTWPKEKPLAFENLAQESALKGYHLVRKGDFWHRKSETIIDDGPDRPMRATVFVNNAKSVCNYKLKLELKYDLEDIKIDFSIDPQNIP